MNKITYNKLQPGDKVRKRVGGPNMECLKTYLNGREGLCKFQDEDGEEKEEWVETRELLLLSREISK